MASLGGLLFRLETAGIALLLLALVSIPWLVPAARGVTDLRDGVVSTFGLLVFVFIVLLAYLGLAIFRRRLDEPLASWKTWCAGLLVIVFVAGSLGFLRPDWHLGDVMLSEVTAGGDAGRLLAGNPIGILVWLAAGAAAFWLILPQGAAALGRGGVAGARTVWGWRLPGRAWASARALADLVFPTRTPPTGAKKVPLESVMESTEPAVDWTPEVDRATAIEEIEAAEYAAGPDEAPPPDFGEQARLPIDGVEGDEGELEPLPAGERRKAHDGWQLPPLDVLLDVSTQEGQPDNAARARLIIDTLASFGVDARVVQVNEGPTVTQFGLEPGWEVRTRQVTERDASGRPMLDKSGQPKARTEEVSRTRVRVNAITVLSNDLALALAAPSLRIESPVPGKPFVGLEVPNHTATL
ncbi:MAG: DNA translocase FtsK, partial [Dehalococcoidia bacterium]|nr:DNA translocase FtsK [Dehalococcoidia bacterium]